MLPQRPDLVVELAERLCESRSVDRALPELTTSPEESCKFARAAGRQLGRPSTPSASKLTFTQPSAIGQQTTRRKPFSAPRRVLLSLLRRSIAMVLMDASQQGAGRPWGRQTPRRRPRRRPRHTSARGRRSAGKFEHCRRELVPFEPTRCDSLEDTKFAGTDINAVHSHDLARHR